LPGLLDHTWFNVALDNQEQELRNELADMGVEVNREGDSLRLYISAMVRADIYKARWQA